MGNEKQNYLQVITYMSKTYDEIMDALLEAYEAHPEMDVDQIIAQVVDEIGASEGCKETIGEASALLDSIQEKKASLEAAQENGDTKKKWMMRQIDEMTEGRTEEERTEIVKAISDGFHRSYGSSMFEKEA